MGRTLRARGARELRARERWLRIALGVAVVAAIVVPAITAANVVPASKASDSSHPVTANQLKPPQCDALNLVNVVTNAGNGSNGNDLVLGTAAGENLNGGQGDDCLVGGDGSDRLNGGGGTDVCLGQGGFDIHNFNCETNDGF